jgi:hypothetical protein
MNHARLVLAGWVVLNLAGQAQGTAAQERRNQRKHVSRQDLVASGEIVTRSRATRTIVDTIVAGDINVSTLRAALEVLPRRPKRIDVVDDRDLSSAILKQVADMDAFVPVGAQTIYLRRQSRTLRDAEYAGGLDTLMLALVIWHEMAHVEGLDERDARRREEELWREFMWTGRVDGSLGLVYLRELQARK